MIDPELYLAAFHQRHDELVADAARARLAHDRLQHHRTAHLSLLAHPSLVAALGALWSRVATRLRPDAGLCCPPVACC